LDTASSFGGGASEEMIGKLLIEMVDRRDMVIVTKAGVRRGPDGPRVDASRRALLADLDQSLIRLSTDHVDLFVVHSWDDSVPLAETLAACEHLVTSGRARYVGVAGYRGWQLARAGTLAEGTRAPIVAAQTEFSLLARESHTDLAPAAQALGAGVIGWSALGRGVLTGKYRRGTPPDSRAASEHFAAYVRPYLGGHSAQVVEAVTTAASGLDAVPAEVAVAWARDAPGIASIVIGARTASQLQVLLGAQDLVLPGPIRAALDDVSSV
ncbi:MAG: aldo/keto reductase, partial [Actinomycetales bacterium]